MERVLFKLKRRPTPPSAILREDYLKPRRVSIVRLALAVGCSRKHMSNLVNGRTRLEPAMAARLAKVFGTPAFAKPASAGEARSAQFWINLQANVDAFDAERKGRAWKPACFRRSEAASASKRQVDGVRRSR